MNPWENTVFRVLAIGIVVMLFAITFFCPKKKENTDQSRLTSTKTASPEPVISNVVLNPPQPSVSDDIVATTTLNDSGMKRVKFHYQWFVNGEQVPANEGRRLKKQHYKRGDNVYCRVKAIRGIYKSKIAKSKEIEIKNATPLITLVPWDNVPPGGHFHYSIKATDPDGDPLTYRLLSPLNLGIDLDPKTGDIDWDTRKIPKPEPIETRTNTTGEGSREGAISTPHPGTKKPETFPSLIKIVFEARDTNGAAAVSSIRLNLTPEGRKPQ
jgi:hypothetical protein